MDNLLKYGFVHHALSSDSSCEQYYYELDVCEGLELQVHCTKQRGSKIEHTTTHIVAGGCVSDAPKLNTVKAIKRWHKLTTGRDLTTDASIDEMQQLDRLFI